jgi:inosine-uridine nucleoside N-ribohydrolase
MSRRVWLDCDPGHDDALALFLACHSAAAVELVGVSTLFGNTTAQNATTNALRVLHAAGNHHVPVHRGAVRPLLSPEQRCCTEIHGVSGLDVGLGQEPLPRGPLQEHQTPAVLAMREAFIADSSIVLVCTGPLTNAALLLSLCPEIATNLEVAWMGGSLGCGNTSAVAEWNGMCDPHAASIVFNAGLRALTMVPLQVTHTVLVTPAILERIGTASPFRRLVRSLLLFFAETYAETFGFHDGPPLHDPVALAAAFAPQLFTFRQLRVDIEIVSPLSAGQTVADVWRQSGKPPQCRVAESVDVAGFWALMLGALDRADKASPLNAAS